MPPVIPLIMEDIATELVLKFDLSTSTEYTWLATLSALSTLKVVGSTSIDISEAFNSLRIESAQHKALSTSEPGVPASP
jgi:hypothetical protein